MGLLVLFFVSASAGGVSAAHFGGLRLLRLFFRIPMRGEPGRPELKARRFHTPVENAIYCRKCHLLGWDLRDPTQKPEITSLRLTSPPAHRSSESAERGPCLWIGDCDLPLTKKSATK